MQAKRPRRRPHCPLAYNSKRRMVPARVVRQARCAMSLIFGRNTGYAEPNTSTPPTTSDAPLTPEQVGTGRRLLGWSASRLGTCVGASAKTILAFEAGDKWSSPLYLDLVRKRLEIEGLEFIGDRNGAPTVRLRKGALGRARRRRRARSPSSSPESESEI
jgi:hypothetical protein